MADQSDLLKTLAASAGALLVGGAILVWPAWRETAVIAEQRASLRHKEVALPERTAEVQYLVAELEAVQSTIHGELRRIPAEPDIAELVRRLSVPVDGLAVHEQTFAASSSVDACADPESRVRAMPLTVEMRAGFDEIFAVLRSVETMRRLVRVSSLRLDCPRPNGDADTGLLEASIGLESIYEPPAAGGF